MSTKLWTFTVEGHPDRGFPLDMLRFDTCWPRRQDDAGTIATLLTQKDSEPGRVKVRLTGLMQPTFGRWESFGWRVSDWSQAQS